MQQLSVNGRRDELLPATSLQVGRGELLLVSDKRQSQRTALALALSGRLKPSAGHFEWDGAEWDGSARIKTLRQASAVVDSPGVNEPEQHLSVRDLVTEDLALIPRRYRGSLLSKPWLKVNRFEDIAGLWTEQLPAARRLELLTALALTNPHTDLLVVDSIQTVHDPDVASSAGSVTQVRACAQAFVDQCVLAHTKGELTAIDAAKAKWWTSQVQNDVLDHCVQLHGGYGFMNEYRVARAWRDARVTKIWAGSNEIMKELIGRDLGL